MSTLNKMPKLLEEPASSSVSADDEVDNLLSRAMDGCFLPDQDRSLGALNSSPTSSEEVAAVSGIGMVAYFESRGIELSSPIGSPESPDVPQEEGLAGVEFEPEDDDEVVDQGFDDGVAVSASDLQWPVLNYDFLLHGRDEGFEEEVDDDIEAWLFDDDVEPDYFDDFPAVLAVFAAGDVADGLLGDNDDEPNSFYSFTMWAEINGLPRPPCLFPEYEYDFLNRLYLIPDEY